MALWIVMGCAVLAGNALLVVALMAGSRRRKTLARMAAQNGWTFAEEKPGGGRGSRLVLSDPAARWTVTIYTHAARSGGSASTRWTRFERPDLGVPGAAVLGPALPQQAAAFAEKVMGSLAGRVLGRLIMGLDEAGVDLARLTHVAEVPGTAGTLFATPEARHALDPVIGHAALSAARAGRGEMDQPIVSRRPGGFRIRVRRALYEPADLAALVTLGEVLAGAVEG